MPRLYDHSSPPDADKSVQRQMEATFIVEVDTVNKASAPTPC